ncbi:hypothetical protein PU629_13265 [Pullulanibacillus sp. KACC 23026]|uniref:hypothetical protein n=1 Tax=Pullulanibacillus sp. KACC 23026 TaxID=3028315 RepID=UPI0023AFDE94|nr:hypothetical protein [Pullulanibacillus sp. KACC 23026]WEG11139.1 hypothetical protein PU629_13265 [Pullulanibacillus sp. KACC 23026]
MMAAHLYRLALEEARAGSQLDGVGDEGVPFHSIRSVIGQYLNVPLKSLHAKRPMRLSDSRHHCGTRQSKIERSDTETLGMATGRLKTCKAANRFEALLVITQRLLLEAIIC